MFYRIIDFLTFTPNIFSVMLKVGLSDKNEPNLFEELLVFIITEHNTTRRVPVKRQKKIVENI